MIIDRLIRRHGAEDWVQIVQTPWAELVAEAATWSAASASLPDSAGTSSLPLPQDLIIVDVPEAERATTAATAFELLSPGGVMLVQEPEVPTGDVGLPSSSSRMTPAQRKVESFNVWIEFVKQISESHSLGFVELTGGTLAVVRRA